MSQRCLGLFLCLVSGGIWAVGCESEPTEGTADFSPPPAGDPDPAAPDPSDPGPDYPELTNDPPVLSRSEGPFEVRRPGALTLELTATDPDGDQVWVVGERLPNGVALSPEGRLVWTPTESQEGEHTLVVGARDDGRPPRADRWALQVRVLPAEAGQGGGGGEDGERPPCDPAAEVTACESGWRCVPRPPGLGGGSPGMCVRTLPEGMSEEALRMGSTLEELLHRSLPDEASTPPDAPIAQVFPRSGAHHGPWSVRGCISDPNGITDIDPASVRVTLQGEDVTERLIWRRTGPNEVCGQPGHPLDSMTQPGPWWLSATGDVVRVEMTVKDWTGRPGADGAEYTRAPPTKVRFAGVTGASGVGLPGAVGNSHTRGVAVIDLDKDTWPDLYVASGQGGSNRLLRNRGDGTFEEVDPGGPTALTDVSTAGVLAADYDGDGDMDLYAMGDHHIFNFGVFRQGRQPANPIPGHPNALLRNDGGGVFVDVTAEAGLQDLTDQGSAFRSVSGAWGDLDDDGCPDLYVVHWRFGAGGDASFSPDRLYRNRCDGTFEDATASAGLDDGLRDGLAVLFTDLDDDGFDDVYLANAFNSLESAMQIDEQWRRGGPHNLDVLWRNEAGQLRDISAAAGVGPHAGLPMGIDLADPDHDGDWDLFITDLNGPVADGNVYYRSLLADTGELRFEEEAFKLGDRPLSGDLGWGTVFGDFDNDGWEDLFYAGEGVRWLWMNNGAGGLSAVAGPHPEASPDITGLPAIDDLVVGVAALDYDRDGGLDLVMVRDPFDRPDQPPLLVRNVTSARGHWLEVALRGRPPATDALGATVIVRSGAESGGDPLVGRRRVVAGHSAQSQSDLVLHFGLGAAEVADEVEIWWPDGTSQTLSGIAADQLLVVEQP